MTAFGLSINQLGKSASLYSLHICYDNQRTRSERLPVHVQPFVVSCDNHPSETKCLYLYQHNFVIV